MSALGDVPRNSVGAFGSPGGPPSAGGHDPAVLRLSERFPADRCIRWNPLPDSYHLLAEMVRSPGDEYKLVVAQAVLKQIDAHLHATTDRVAVGLLLGQIYDCPESGIQYTVVRGIERIPDALVAAEGEEITDESWRAIDPEIRRHGARVLGWYRSRARVTSQLPPLDAAAHMKRFKHPWQTALLVSPDLEQPRGAFYVYEARVGRIAERRECVRTRHRSGRRHGLSRVLERAMRRHRDEAPLRVTGHEESPVVGCVGRA